MLATLYYDTANTCSGLGEIGIRSRSQNESQKLQHAPGLTVGYFRCGADLLWKGLRLGHTLIVAPGYTQMNRNVDVSNDMYLYPDKGDFPEPSPAIAGARFVYRIS
jgi:hypothetical protein